MLLCAKNSLWQELRLIFAEFGYVSDHNRLVHHGSICMAVNNYTGGDECAIAREILSARMFPPVACNLHQLSQPIKLISFPLTTNCVLALRGGGHYRFIEEF